MKIVRVSSNRAIKASIINPLKERFAIAPMVDVTDNHFRYFTRLLTKHSFLYTEMLNEHAILHIEKTGKKRLLNFTENQHPVVG
jgi:tRNA-dihydrouridine synthase A